MPTFSNDLAPDTTGRKVGLPDARFDGNFRDLNVTGIVSGNFQGLSIYALGAPVLVPFSATPIFDLNGHSAFKIVLTGNVTSPAFINPSAGQLVMIEIVQDAIGNRSFAWPANVRGGMAIGTLGSEISAQLFLYDGAQYIPLTPGAIS
jgi:hypothetical protein